MSWMNEVGALLQQYRGASGSAAPANAAEDFGKIADKAPPSALSGGLAEAFRSNSTPAFGEMISGLFSQSDGAQRAGILNHLIAAAGPAMSSGAVAGGLSALLSGGGQRVTPEQAQQVRPEEVQQLASQAEKRDPTVIDRASEFYAQHPTLVKGLGAGALAVLMSHLSQRH